MEQNQIDAYAAAIRANATVTSTPTTAEKGAVDLSAEPVRGKPLIDMSHCTHVMHVGNDIYVRLDEAEKHVSALLAAQPVAQRPTDDELWDQTIRDRDTYHEWADRLAEAIAKYFSVDIGEHSNMNLPWAEALEAVPETPLASSLRYATHIATCMSRDNFPDSRPDWEPLGDLHGVLSQIDNMSCWLVRAPVASKEAVSEPAKLNERERFIWQQGFNAGAERAPTIAAEGVPSVDTPEFRNLMTLYRQSTSWRSQLIAHLNADKAAAVESAYKRGMSKWKDYGDEQFARAEAAEGKVRELEAERGEVVAWMLEFEDERVVTADPKEVEMWRTQHDNPYEVTSLHAFKAAQEAAKPSEGSGAAIEWTPGPNEWKDWCTQYFGPDADDDYLAKAVFNLPPMAQRFARAALAQPAEPGGGDKAAGIIAAAVFIEKRAEQYLQDHASHDPDDGSLIFNYGQAGRDYHSGLVELAEEVRALATSAERSAQ